MFGFSFPPLIFGLVAVGDTAVRTVRGKKWCDIITPPGRSIFSRSLEPKEQLKSFSQFYFGYSKTCQVRYLPKLDKRCP